MVTRIWTRVVISSVLAPLLPVAYVLLLRLAAPDGEESAWFGMSVLLTASVTVLTVVLAAIRAYEELTSWFRFRSALRNIDGRPPDFEVGEFLVGSWRAKTQHSTGGVKVVNFFRSGYATERIDQGPENRLVVISRYEAHSVGDREFVVHFLPAIPRGQLPNNRGLSWGRPADNSSPSSESADRTEDDCGHERSRFPETLFKVGERESFLYFSSFHGSRMNCSWVAQRDRDGVTRRAPGDVVLKGLYERSELKDMPISMEDDLEEIVDLLRAAHDQEGDERASVGGER